MTAVASAAPEVLTDTDFGTADQPILGRGGTPNQRVTGVMAGEWRDDSGWSENVRASWERMEEEGRGFARLTVTAVEPDRYQLAHVLPKVTEETFYRLAFTARSASGVPVEIGVRDSGPPYQFHWRERVPLGAEWRELRYDFRLTALEQDVGFWINTDRVGAVDLARFHLERLTRADYIEELRREYGEGRPKNLVRASRFPLGLPSGWALGRDNSDGDDVIIEPDPDVVGPSGSPALRVQAEEPTVLWSAPFSVPLAFEPHTASIYARAAGQMRLVVLCDGRQIAERTVDLPGPTEWSRPAVTFTPVFMARTYGLRIEGQGGYWLDALQVETGSEPTAYESQGACEVALALPPSDASVAGVQFPDEPAQVRFLVTGDRGRGVLKARVLNAYGEEQAILPPTRRAAADSGNLRYDVFPERPYGPFRIEAWVEAADGERISPYEELVVYRLPRPRHWGQDAPDSPFGVHTNSTTRHNLMAKAIGVNWTRLHDAGLEYLGWWWLEREPGKWTFRDKEIRRYRRDHIKVLGELGTAPEWASYYPGPHNGYFDRYYQPKRMEDYANYVRTVTERYRGVIDAYDVWNEPWIHAWWGVGYDDSRPDRAGYVTSENPTGDFVRLMETAFETARAVDGGITVLGVNSTTGTGGTQSMGGTDWTRGVVEAGGLDFCDVVCYHQYIGGKPGYPGDVVEQGFQAATGPIVERFGRQPKPVWMTEGSAARDTIGDGFYHHTVPYENRENVFETSDRLCRYVTSLLAQGVAKLFLYSMHAQSTFNGTAGGGWRVIVTPEGQLHPSGAAHGILAWHLEGTTFRRAVTLADDLHAYLFEAEDGSRSVAVIMGLPGHEPYATPGGEGLVVRDIFGNPVPAGTEVGEYLLYASTDGPAATLREMLKG